MNYPSGELVTLYKLVLEDDGRPSNSDTDGDNYTIGVTVPAGGRKDRSMTFTGEIKLVPNDRFYDKYDQRAGYHYYRGPGAGKMLKDPYAYKWYEDPYWYDDDHLYDHWYEDDYDYETLQEELEKK